MNKPHGYIISTGGVDDTKHEADTVQCAHCGRHYAIRPKENPTDAGSYCGRCNAPICNGCGETMTRTLVCTPFERMLEAWEQKKKTVAEYLGLS